jgi:argininosuccinate lyase
LTERLSASVDVTTFSTIIIIALAHSLHPILLDTQHTRSNLQDVAEYLVRKGMPFRDTHHIAGAAVKLAEDKKVRGESERE